MKLLAFIIIFLYSTYSFAQSGFVTVENDNVIQVIQDGEKYYLKSGDLIQVKEKDGWKRQIKIITSIADGVKVGNAYMGDSVYAQHIMESNLSSLAPGTKSSYLTKSIEVVLPNGSKMMLSPGDEIKVRGIDGWKRKVDIINSKTGIKGTAILGNTTYLDYVKNGVFSDIIYVNSDSDAKKQDAPYEYDSMDNLIKELILEQAEETVDEEELTDGVEVTNDYASCPEVGKTFRIDRFINVTNKNKRTLGVPKGSTIRMKSNGVTCSLQVLELPEETSLNLKIYGQEVVTFPSNLNSDFLTEIEPPSEAIKLDSGVKFRLGDNSSVHAYGRRTGKRYKFTPKDRVTVVGKHRNGDYIVKRNDEKWEYRIPYEDLDELNDNAQVSIDALGTAAEIIQEEKIEEAVSVVEPDYECQEDTSFDESSAPDVDDINWQNCRTKSIKNNKGKTLAANNYMDKEINLNNSEVDDILEDPEKRQFAKCISTSLRHGTNRSSNPSCAKDSKGEIIPTRIRQARYRTSNGKRKFAGWNLLHRAPKACASKKLSTHLADRFVDMTKCLGVDAKELFPVINHESHFQPKTISPTFALGVGQIVSVNYLDFYNKLNQAKSLIKSNSSVLDYARPLSTKEGYRKYEDSPSKSKKISRLTGYFLSDLKDKMTGNDPSCKGLREIYNKPLKVPSSIKKSTSKTNDYLRDRENQRLCSPKNPDEGFYMSAIYYMYNKKYFRYMLEKENKKNNLRMSKKQLNDFSVILARWSYNGGVAGISVPFERLVEKIQDGKIEALNKNNDPDGNKQRSVSGFSNFSNDDFKSYMSYVIKHRYKAGNARRLEVARYLPGSNGVGGIDGDLKKIEKGEENSCGTSF